MKKLLLLLLVSIGIFTSAHGRAMNAFMGGPNQPTIADCKQQGRNFYSNKANKNLDACKGMCKNKYPFGLNRFYCKRGCQDSAEN
jgi:hypothetical protein